MALIRTIFEPNFAKKSKRKFSVEEPEPVEPKLFEICSQSEKIFLIYIYCSHFGGYLDEEKLISTSISMVPVPDR